MTTKPQWQIPTDNMPDGWYWIEGLDMPILLMRYRGKWVNRRGEWPEEVVFGRRVAPCTGRPE